MLFLSCYSTHWELILHYCILCYPIPCYRMPFYPIFFYPTPAYAITFSVIPSFGIPICMLCYLLQWCCIPCQHNTIHAISHPMLYLIPCCIPSHAISHPKLHPVPCHMPSHAVSHPMLPVGYSPLFYYILIDILCDRVPHCLELSPGQLFLS